MPSLVLPYNYQAIVGKPPQNTAVKLKAPKCNRRIGSEGKEQHFTGFKTIKTSQKLLCSALVNTYDSLS